MDQRDPASRIVRELESKLPFLTGRVNRRKQSLGPKDHELLPWSQGELAGSNLVVCQPAKVPLFFRLLLLDS